VGSLCEAGFSDSQVSAGDSIEKAPKFFAIFLDPGCEMAIMSNGGDSPNLPPAI
jgi:hypothetical protein